MEHLGISFIVVFNVFRGDIKEFIFNKLYFYKDNFSKVLAFDTPYN